MTTGFDEFDNRIHDLVERENDCDDLFKDIKNGNGENLPPLQQMRQTGELDSSFQSAAHLSSSG